MIDQAHKLRGLVSRGPMRETGVQERQPGRFVDGKQCRTIAVTSGKGGVGKSNMALMLSIALTRLKKRVLLLDADLGLANIHILLGIAPRRNVSDLVNGTAAVEEILCGGPEGLHILPGASGLEAMANLDSLQLEILSRRLAGLEQQFDYMVIDTSAGIGRTTTELCRHADTSLVVLTPEPTALADAYAMVKVLQEKKSPKQVVMVNMALSDHEGREMFDKLSALVVRFLGKPIDLLEIIPTDPEVPRLIKRQRVFLLEHPNREVSVRICAAARKLCGLPSAVRPSFFSRIFRPARTAAG